MQEAVFCMLVYDLDSACLDGWAMHKGQRHGSYPLAGFFNHR
jgi:hypothetical protein